MCEIQADMFCESERWITVLAWIQTSFLLYNSFQATAADDKALFKVQNHLQWVVRKTMAHPETS